MMMMMMMEGDDDDGYILIRYQMYCYKATKLLVSARKINNKNKTQQPQQTKILTEQSGSNKNKI